MGGPLGRHASRLSVRAGRPTQGGSPPAGKSAVVTCRRVEEFLPLNLCLPLEIIRAVPADVKMEMGNEDDGQSRGRVRPLRPDALADGPASRTSARATAC